MVVCARRETGGVPEIGAWDQYMPDAGAGCTSGAVSGEGRGGNAVYGRCWAGTRCDGVVFRDGAGDVVFPSEGFGAMADVERRFRGRDARGLLILRFGEDAEGLGVRCVGDGRVVSDFEGMLPLLYMGGSFVDLGDVVDSLCDSDWDRCRGDTSAAFFRRSWLLVDRWPGVWLRGSSFGGSESSGISCGRPSVGDICMIWCGRTFFVLADDLDAFSRSDDLEESAIVNALRILRAEAFKHCPLKSSRGGWQELEAERGMVVSVSHKETTLPWLI